MKSHIHLALVSLLSAALCCTALAGVPLSWSVDVTRVEPVRLDAYHGETLDLSAKLMQGRASLAVPAGAASFLWQTNGMGAAWWQTNATVSADGVVRGTFGPPMDTGADAVRFFFSVVSGSGANYRAAGTIALRPSPGATPTTADLAPQTAINFADYQLVNAPWLTAADAEETVSAATNALATVLQASDNALSSAIADAAQAATNYAESVAASVNDDLVAATNAHLAVVRLLSSSAATAASNYTDAAVASITIPSLDGYATETWTHQAISNAMPVVPSLDGYATEAWVQGRGYITEHQSLAGYATEAWTHMTISNALPAVPSLDGYATETWVQGRGYLTEHQSLSGYATEAWVNGRGFLTEHQPLTGYATEAWTRQLLTNSTSTAPSIEGYATEAWVNGRGFLTEHQSLSGYATEAYVSDSTTSARESAEAYARNLAWAASSGSTRLVSLDGATWQDATGTVWQTSAVYGWAGTVIDLSTATARPIQFSYAGSTDHPHAAGEDYWSAGAGTNLFFGTNMGYTWTLWFTNSYYGAEANSLWTAAGDPPLSATNITINTSNEFYTLYYRPVALVTNPVDRVLYASSGASGGVSDRALSVGTPTRWTDATGCVWEVMLNVWVDHAEGNVFKGGTSIFPSEGEGDMRGYLYYDPAAMEYVGGTGGGWYYNGSNSGETPGAVFAGGPDATSLDNGRFTFGNFTNLVSRVAYTNDIPATLPESDPTVPEWAKEPSPPSYSAADVGAAPASIVPVLTSVSNDAATAKLNSETALRIVLGESVWFAVTNYMRTAEGVIPSLQLWEVRDGATNLVYDSREEITNTVRALTTELRTELESRIPSKAWGNYQSDGTDNPQPGEVAIINPPTIILTGGGTFNKYIEVGDSSVWVLQSSGPVSFGGNTNGNFFAVHDDEGNTHFKVAKTDSYDLPMFISDILPRQSQNHILIYTATTNRQGNAVAQPVLFAANDLKNSTWHEEVEGEIDALGITVSWAKDETIPAWVATITPDVWHEKMFFRAKVTQEGGVAVINTAPVRFDGGVQIGNGTYRLVPYTTGGKTYLTLETIP